MEAAATALRLRLVALMALVMACSFVEKARVTEVPAPSPTSEAFVTTSAAKGLPLLLRTPSSPG